MFISWSRFKLLLLIIPLFLVLVVLWLMAPTSSQPQISIFKTNIPKSQSWVQLLAKPSPLEYQLIHAGDITIDRNDLLQNAPDSWADRYKPIPVLSHWLRHPVHGELLIDAAFSNSFKEDNTGSYSRMMKMLVTLSSIENKLERSLTSQLPNNGTEIKQLFITHFHPDHTAGLDDLPVDLPVVAGLSEYDFLARLTNGDLFDRRSNWLALDFTQGIEVPPFKKVLDVFGDGSLFAISTPGHTAGHTSFLINAAQGAKLIVGDASHFSFGFNNNLAPSAIGDGNALLAKKSLSQLILFKKQYPEVEVILGHEFPNDE